MVEGEAAGQQEEDEGEEGEEQPDGLDVVGHLCVGREVVVAVEAGADAVVEVVQACQRLQEDEPVE